MTLNLSEMAQPKTAICPITKEAIATDFSHRFGVGFSHYKLDENGQLVRSYAQIFNTLHCKDRASALQAIRSRIDNHHNVPFGAYDADVHNPDESHIDHDNGRMLVEYNTLGITPRGQLPKTCAITGKPLTTEWYIPHVDDSTRGTTYQNILKKQHPGASIEQLTLGACSMEHAKTLAHAILDEIVEPDYQAESGGHV